MEQAKQYGINILQNRVLQPNDAVMFDIDDTLIYYDTEPNTHIIDLLNISKVLGYKVILITARPDFEDNRQITENELKKHNIYFDLLFYTNHRNKQNIKEQLSSTFVLSVGDMWSDLTNSLHFIKLPSKYKNETKVICA